jgi:hypothetical protein
MLSRDFFRSNESKSLAVLVSHDRRTEPKEAYVCLAGLLFCLSLVREDSVRLFVGDLVHNEITQEEGRIVRIVKIDGRHGYVVVKATKPFGHEIEALWRPQELKEGQDRVRKFQSASGDSLTAEEPGDFQV